MKKFKFISGSEKETIHFATKLGKVLKENDCLALVGDFGSGKTTFVKGLARGLGVRKKDYVSSPSFVILKIYQGRLPVYHFDLYRLKREEDCLAVGLLEFVNAKGVAAIEWAGGKEKLLPPGYLEIKFFVKGRNKREFHFFARTARQEKLFKKVIG